MSAPEFKSQLKIAFRFSKVRIPRAFNDKRLKSTLLRPNSPKGKTTSLGGKS